MFTFWFAYDSNLDSFYNLLGCVCTTSLIFFVELSKSSSFEFIDIEETINVNKNKIKYKSVVKIGNSLKINNKIIENINDLIKTFFLNTAIIEKEWIINLKIGTLDWPAYLNPLTEFMLWRILICFFTVPEKLHHRSFLFDISNKSFFVRQL